MPLSLRPVIDKKCCDARVLARIPSNLLLNEGIPMIVKKLLVMVLAAFVLAGCATTGNDFSSNQIDEIVVGQTTKADIVSWFGEPSARTESSAYDAVFTYLYSETRANAMSLIPGAGIFGKGMDSSHKTLMVFFSKDNLVREHSYTEGTL